MVVQDFSDYLKIEKNYSLHTVRAYTDDVEVFREFVEKEFEGVGLEQVNYSMIRSWIVAMVDRGVINRSINRKVSSLQAFYKFLLRSKQIEVSPLEKHRSLRVSKKLQVPFSQSEMEQVVSVIETDSFEGVRDRLMVELFYSTGIRRNELISIHLKDLSGARLRVRGKGNKERIVPLLPSAVRSLEVYKKKRNELPEIIDQEYLFLTQKGKRVYPNLVYRVIRYYFSRISTKEKISPHILRHSFATHLLNEGADINAIKELLGHESLSSTQIYTHNDIAVLRQVHQKAHPRNKRNKK